MTKYLSFLDENKFCNRVMYKFCYDVELTFCSFLSKFTYSKNLKTGTIHLKGQNITFTVNVLLTRILYSVTPGPAMIRAVYEYSRLILSQLGTTNLIDSGDMYANSIRRITSFMISILT